MRRVVTVGLAAAAAGGAVFLTVPSWASHGHPQAVNYSHAHAKAQRIAASLSSHAVRTRYGFTVGTLISTDVCVHGKCVHKQFAPEPTCGKHAAVCVGTTVFARRLPHAVTISVELAG